MAIYRKVLLFTTLLLVPVFYVAAAAADTIIPGTIEGEGNYFEITDSEYLNISLESSEPVKIRAESIPEIIMIGLESVSSAKSTEISLSGLAPSTTYYKYQDDFHNLEIFVSDENGNYTYSQNLIESHFIFIQTRKSTKFIKDDPIGGDCASIGDWDVSSKTCTLNIDINQTIQIDNDNVTLDGSGQTLTGTWQIVGVYLYKRTGVTIKNLNIEKSAVGIQVRESNNNTFIGNTLDSNSAYGMVFYPSSNNNTVTKNTFSHNRYFGVHIVDSIYNKIYNNNFIGNYTDPYAKIRWQLNFARTIGNIAYMDPPTGGNYWDDFDNSSEGCNDANNDNFCDAPYVFSGGQDNYPLTKLNGWLEPPSDEPERNPVIIVPGIAGTELYNGDDLIWLNLSKLFLDIDDLSFNDYFITDNLSLDELGNSLIPITAPNVIKNKELLEYEIDIFNSLELNLKTTGYEKDQTYFFFPYDWRLNLETTKTLLNQKIEELKLQTGKVDIVAHSMGGLLTKAYLDTYGNDAVDKLIFVGTPHLGAPKAGKVLLQGDRFGIPWLENDRIKEIAENSPAIHQLLPSKTYFSQFQGYIKVYGDNQLRDYESTKTFFVEDNDKNPLMFQIAEAFSNKNYHDTNLDGLDVYNIAGCKQSTQSAYFIGGLGAITKIGYSSGDGTVPFVSADHISTPGPNKFYVKNGDHAELSSTDGVRELITGILNEDTGVLSDNISNSSSFCNFKGKTLTWRSPVEIHIYDGENHHTGPIENGAIEYGVSGVDYEIIGHEKFIFLPTDDAQMYRVEARGTDDGTFDLLISENENGLVLETSVFNDIPVDTSTQIQFEVSDTSEDNAIEIKVGEANPVIIETNLILNSEESDDAIPPETQIILTGKEYKDGEYKKEVEVSLNVTDDNSGVLETKYSLDGQNFFQYAGTFTLGIEGVYNVYYYSVDRAGNNEEIKSAEIIVGKLSKILRKIED